MNALTIPTLTLTLLTVPALTGAESFIGDEHALAVKVIATYLHKHGDMLTAEGFVQGCRKPTTIVQKEARDQVDQEWADEHAEGVTLELLTTMYRMGMPMTSAFVSTYGKMALYAVNSYRMGSEHAIEMLNAKYPTFCQKIIDELESQAVEEASPGYRDLLFQGGTR